MIEKYLSLLENIPSEKNKYEEFRNVRSILNLALDGSQTAYDTILEFERKKRFGFYKDRKLINEPNCLLLQVADKTSPFKNKQLFEKSMMRVLELKSSNFTFDISPEQSFFMDYQELLSDYIPILIFKQDYLEDFEEKFIAGKWAVFSNKNIFSSIIIYSTNFFKVQFAEHEDLANFAYFYACDDLNFTKFLDCFKNREKFIDKVKSHQNISMVSDNLKTEPQKIIDDEKSYDELNKRIYIVKDNWDRLYHIFRDIENYSLSGRYEDWTKGLTIPKDELYFPLKLTTFGNHFLAGFIVFSKQCQNIIRYANLTSEKADYMGIELISIFDKINKVNKLSDYFIKTYPSLNNYIKHYEENSLRSQYNYGLID